MNKKLPIGIDGFEKIRKNNFYYVDKTMLIAELLQNWGEVNLFTRPRRFGKTLNMSMLKCFFEVGCDKTLFDGLNISQEKELCEQYMGQFPVISISLKSIDGLNYRQAYGALCSVIGMEAMRFYFLTESEKLSVEEKAMYTQLIKVGNEQGGMFAMTDTIMLTSLKVLSQLLSRHYGRKVILLIDEYDVPLDKAFQRGYYEEMVSLIRNLFGNALKTNDALQFAVLTGCLRISKESIFTGLNNLNVMTVSDPYFCDSFGFTDDEVRELLRFYGLEEFYNTMRDWYDGYQFGTASIYCPWDVIKYVQILLRDREAEPENYWANTSGNDLVRRFIEKANNITKIEAILNGTTNYILTKMDAQGASYENVLKEAQELGYAETDPTGDVEGFDAAYKITTLATIAFKKRIKLENVYREGITKIRAQDMQAANDLGYKIKLIASAYIDKGGRADVRVHPMLVSKKSTLAHIDYVTNAVSLSGHPIGDITLSGPGAGEFPTASSVVGDILAISAELGKSDYILPMMRCRHNIDAEPIDISDTDNKYYLSINAKNNKGVIGKIGKICADNNISLASIVQRGVSEDNTADITVITELCREKDMQNALQAFENDEYINKVNNLIRVQI